MRTPDLYPRHQWMHQKKGLPIHEVQLVDEGRVIQWATPDTVALALTAIDDRRNWRYATTTQRHVYRRKLDAAVLRLDVRTMRSVIRANKNLVPQSIEILKLPDHLLYETAALMVSAIIQGL